MNSREIILTMLRAVPPEVLGEFVRRMPDDELESLGRSVFGSLADGTGDARPKPTAELRREVASKTAGGAHEERVYAALFAARPTGTTPTEISRGIKLEIWHVTRALKALGKRVRKTGRGRGARYHAADTEGS